jgi:hypothetical protein
MEVESVEMTSGGDKTVDEAETVKMVPQVPIEEPKPAIEKTLSPSEVYQLLCEDEQPDMKNNLLSLYNLGFADFDKNKKTLVKMCQDIEKAANALFAEADDDLYN